MDLFNTEIDCLKNLLPYHGLVNYYGKILTSLESNSYFDNLLNTIEWENDQSIIYGKLIVTKRKVAWYGDTDFEYSYSNNIKRALPWTKDLLDLKAIIEEKTNEKFNSCLLNLYHDGNEGMGWHSDAEKELKKNGAIGSLSFGAERKFIFKHKQTNERIPVILENGSLLVMKDTTQSNWQHRLPPTKRIIRPRINLTFRTIEHNISEELNKKFD
jgi:alkylated DNA repair dioxygenase AlkB